MVNGFLILEDGSIQTLGVIERWDAVTEALKRLTTQVEMFGAEQNKKKELLSKLSLEELEELVNKQ